MRPTRHLRRAERGVSIVIIALCSMVLIGIAAIAIDLGIAQDTRRDIQATVDTASLAGVHEWTTNPVVDDEHYVAMQYLSKDLGFAMGSVSACSGKASGSCPAGTYSTGGYTIVFTDDGSGSFDLSVKYSRRSVLGGVLGFASTVSGTSGRVVPTGPSTIGTGYAVAAVGGAILIHGGGVGSNPSGDVSGPVYADTTYGANNVPHTTSVTSSVEGYSGTGSGISNCNSPAQTNHVDFGGAGDAPGVGDWEWSNSGSPGTMGTNVSAPGSAFASDAPSPSGGTYTTAAAASYTSGTTTHWRPGTYNGIYPTSGVLDPGVFAIKNVSSTIALGGVTNATLPSGASSGRGQSDGANAVAFVVDSTDTGTLDLNNLVLNGVDDLNPTGPPPHDTAGTHNFAIWGGTFTGGLAPFQPGDTTNITGIIYLPHADITEHGVASPEFAGSVYVNTVTIDGGGNGVQVFAFVCGLSAIGASSTNGGLTR